MSARNFGVLGLACLLVAGCTSATHSASPNGSGASAAATSSAAGGSTSPSTSPTTAGSASKSGSPGGTGSAAPTSPGRGSGPAGGPVPAGFVPYSATFVDADHAWVLGNAPCSKAPCTSLVRSRDGGKSWQGVPAPKAAISGTTPRRGASVSTVRFANPSDGWVAGGSFYATHDGGASWHPVRVGPAGGAVTAVGAVDGRAYAARNSCDFQAPAGCKATTTVYSAAVGSDRWTAVSAALSDASFALVVSGSGWYLATEAGIYTGHGSAAATRIANPCPTAPTGTATPTLAVADARHLDAICVGGGAAGSSAQQLYGTSDGGKHWQQAGPSRREPSGLYGMADNGRGVLLVAVASGDDEILRTADDGATLGKVKTVTAGGLPWADLGFTTPSQAVAVLAQTGMYLSRDAGKTWTQVRF
jgi:photosystem II stability/assembly factor-like uncharacterized protein